MVIFGRTSALLLAMVLLLLSVDYLLPIYYKALRLPERSPSAKFTLVELVAEAGFEPTTQRL